MADFARNSTLELIQVNIAKYGHHILLVSGGMSPRFAYTIGISNTMGTELILAGASFYSAEDVNRIINEIAGNVGAHNAWHQLSYEVSSLGVFSLRKVDTSWTNALMLGALDFYSASDIPALQIVPDQAHLTVDVPNLTQPWSATAEPVWRWLHEPWGNSVSPRSVAVTNLGALRGERVTEAARWEEDQWELFAGSGPDTPPDEIRVVPLSTLLAVDESLNVVTSLEVGQALWRDTDELGWHQWGHEKSQS